MKQFANRKHGRMLKEWSHYSENRNISEFLSYQKPRDVDNYRDGWLFWDYDPDYRIVSKSWKDQSKRKHQYKEKILE